MSGDGDNQPKQNHKERRKHSQKDKSQTLTLQQLHGGMGLEDIPQSTKPRKSPVVEDEKFFEKVEKDVEKLVLKEERDRFRKVNDRFAAESIRKVQFEDILSKKDEEISKLSEIVTKLKDELQTVKKRNKQLCLILAQGEMKEKAVILKQVDELNNDKDEYIQQVSELTASLEQERSKVSNLKTELQKYQYSSHHHHQDKKK
ncbi:G kinase-anchoring protein 1-A-like [Saccoglossus kowalevskii]|uniref:G kinase-anchoring protein 1-like n=1 Tax=Saccoglossus kowalevskii TaxID=10224 RepID=A0ABM0MWA2_SACKO|nr:PREDICTED: G kinase-anchoring protein 1-like [Saccoglossus kowalevskii]